MGIWGSGAAGRRHAGSSAHFIISRKTKPEVYFPNKAPGPGSARWSQTPSLTFLPAARGNGSFFKPRASFPAQPASRSDPPPGPGVPSAAGAASIVPGERGPASPVGTPSTPGMSPALLYPPPNCSQGSGGAGALTVRTSRSGHREVMEAKHREHCRTSTAGRAQPLAGGVTDTLSTTAGTWGSKESVSAAARLGRSPLPCPQ